MNNYVISENQISKFKELGEEVATRASNSLNVLLGHAPQIHAVDVNIASSFDLHMHIDEAESLYSVAALRMSDGLNGMLLMLIPESGAVSLSHEVLNKHGIDPEAHPEMEMGVLKEVLNILSEPFFTKLASVIGERINQSVPDISTDMLKATLDEVSSEFLEMSDTSFVFSVEYTLETLNLNVRLALVLDSISAMKVLEKFS